MPSDDVTSVVAICLAIAAAYIAYLEFRRTKMALDLSKLQAVTDNLKAERDEARGQLASEQAADQAQVDALTASLSSAPVPVPEPTPPGA